jgi:hypothetical protein
VRAKEGWLDFASTSTPRMPPPPRLATAPPGRGATGDARGGKAVKGKQGEGRQSRGSKSRGGKRVSRHLLLELAQLLTTLKMLLELQSLAHQFPPFLCLFYQLRVRRRRRGMQ